MELNPEETRAGMRWFWVVGAFAIALSYGLFLADRGLQNSPRERELGSTLRELRGAQSGLGRGSVDPRITQDFHSLRTSKDVP